MAQSTLVLQIDTQRARELRARLDDGRFEFRPVPYAQWSVKGDGVVATLYTSGKLVIQGGSPELFAERYVGSDYEARGPAREKRARAPSAAAIDHGATVGSDECGKGDYFGPLIVAGVRLEEGQAEQLRRSGVRDSKTLSDEACLKLGGALRGVYPHAIARLDPPEYNALHRRAGQLNDMLADLHARVIEELHRPGMRVVIDQFADARVMQKKLARLDIALEQRPRAESEPAVAAASVIAREEFLLAMRALSDEYVVELHKGAGAPVDRVARQFVALHGKEALGRVAKLHFKNTARIA